MERGIINMDEIPNFTEWIEAANLAMSRLYENASNEAAAQFELYKTLAIASSLCAIAAAIKERG